MNDCILNKCSFFIECDYDKHVFNEMFAVARRLSVPLCGNISRNQSFAFPHFESARIAGLRRHLNVAKCRKGIISCFIFHFKPNRLTGKKALTISAFQYDPVHPGAGCLLLGSKRRSTMTHGLTLQLQLHPEGVFPFGLRRRVCDWPSRATHLDVAH